MILFKILLIFVISIMIVSGWIFVVVPELKSLSSDFELLLQENSHSNRVMEIGGPLTETKDSSLLTTMTGKDVGNNILEITVTIGPSDPNESGYSSEEVYFVDRLTRKISNSASFFMFPINIEKQNYLVTHPSVSDTNVFVFQKAEKIFGLETYLFSCENFGTDITGNNFRFPDIPLFYDGTCSVWIEPKTGNQIKFEQSWNTYTIDDGIRFDITKGNKQNSNYAINILVQSTENKIQTYELFDYVIPLLLGIISVGVFTTIFSFIYLQQKNKIILKVKNELIISIKKLENFKLALDNSASVAITDSNGTITYANDMFCNLSKYSHEELIGNNHRILKSGYHKKEFYENMWNTITSGKIWYGDIQNKTRGGAFYWVKTMIMPIFNNDGNIENYIAIRTDITPRVKLAAKLVKAERMSSIGQLASRMAHDIRNPLSIIRISLENLKLKYGADDSTGEQFDRVSRSIDRIAHQIDDVLDFVKGTPTELNKVMMSEIIQESLDSFTIPDDIELILPKNDVEFFADRRLFSVVMNNLILNGIQAIDGKGTIEVTIEENDEIIIQVKDSGIGISKENIDKIFDPLFTTRMHGTGLGLSSVKSIIESHGGIISVTSPPTIFTITLPKTNS